MTRIRSSKDIIIIVCAGGHSQDVNDVAISAGYSVIGYLDDKKDGELILGKISDYQKVVDKYKNYNVKYSIGINSSKIRKEIDLKLKTFNALPATLIHSSAIIGNNVILDEGVVLGPGSVITSNVKIGKHVHLNTHASVNQGSSIGNYCTLSPGVKICGDVQVGECVQFGANSTVINFKTIGDNVTLGAGAVVINDIPNNVTAKGVPAKFG